MKKSIMGLVATLVLAIFNFINGQTNVSSSVTKNEISSSAQTKAGNKTEQELQKILKEILNANISGDKKVIERYLAANFIETEPSGKVNTREQVLEEIRAMPAGYHATGDIEDIKMQEYGNMVVMNSKTSLRFETNGDKKLMSFRFTHIFLKQNGGGWKVIAQHLSVIPAEKTAVKVDSKIYNSYVGQYQLTPGALLTLTQEGNKLMGQVTGGKTKFEFVPENDSTFVVKDQTDQVVFVKDDKGQVSHIIHRYADGQEGKEIKIK